MKKEVPKNKKYIICIGLQTIKSYMQFLNIAQDSKVLTLYLEWAKGLINVMISVLKVFERRCDPAVISKIICEYNSIMEKSNKLLV